MLLLNIFQQITADPKKKCTPKNLVTPRLIGHFAKINTPFRARTSTLNMNTIRKVYSVFSTVFLLLLLLVVAVGCPAAGFG